MTGSASYSLLRRLETADAFPKPGDRIEIRRWGRILRRGSVETVMPDKSGLWLAQEGVDMRTFVHLSYGDLEIWS